MKNFIIATVVAVSAITTAPAHAQLGSLLGKAKAQSTDATASAAPNNDALVHSFTQSLGLVLTAQATVAEALGLKQELDLLRSEQQAIGGGAVNLDAMKKATELSESAQKAINARLEAQPELTAASRTKFGEALVQYVRAAAGGAQLLSSAQGFAASIGANPMALVGKAKTAAWVAKETPGYVKALGGTTRSLIEYGKRNGVKTPAQATAALQGL